MDMDIDVPSPDEEPTVYNAPSAVTNQVRYALVADIRHD